jgi:hypothetical protein
MAETIALPAGAAIAADQERDMPVETAFRLGVLTGHFAL